MKELNTKGDKSPTHPSQFLQFCSPEAVSFTLLLTLSGLNNIVMLLILDGSILDLAYSLSAKIGKDFTKLTTFT